MRPDLDLTVSEWADAHRWLLSRAAAEPGSYRTARAPYLREIMDALSPRHPAQRIGFMKAAQVGATEAGNNWIGFVIHHAPGPILYHMAEIHAAIAACNLFVVIGSSGTVYPDAGFASTARECGIRTLSINLDHPAGASSLDEMMTGTATHLVPRLVNQMLGVV